VNILHSNLLNIIGLVLEIIGAFLIAFYILAGGTVGLQRHAKFISKFSSVGKNSFSELKGYWLD